MPSQESSSSVTSATLQLTTLVMSICRTRVKRDAKPFASLPPAARRKRGPQVQRNSSDPCLRSGPASFVALLLLPFLTTPVHEVRPGSDHPRWNRSVHDHCRELVPAAVRPSLPRSSGLAALPMVLCPPASTGQRTSSLGMSCRQLSRAKSGRPNGLCGLRGAGAPPRSSRASS